MVTVDIRRIALALAVAILLTAGVACGGGNQPDATSEAVTASVLVEPTEDEAQWFRDVEVPAGTDGYELLLAATDGEVEADWFPEFQSHFVEAILGVAADGDEFWGAFLWNEHSDAWEPLAYGADWFSVKDGHIMGWAIVTFSPDTPQLPSSTP